MIRMRNNVKNYWELGWWREWPWKKEGCWNWEDGGSTEIRKLLNVNIKARYRTVWWESLSLTVLASVSSVLRLAVAGGLVAGSHAAGSAILTEILTDGLTTVWSSEPQGTAAGGSPCWKWKQQKGTLTEMFFMESSVGKKQEAKILIRFFLHLIREFRQWVSVFPCASRAWIRR